MLFSENIGRSALIWSCGIAALGATAWYNYHIYPWMLDDAFIAFRYVDNFAAGHGFVYNIGERVEGYTSFLWVLLLGLGRMAGLETVLISKILGAFFGVATIGVLMNTHRYFPAINRLSGAVAALFLGTCGVFMPWLGSGMEVTLFTLLTLATLVLYVNAINGDERPSLFMIVGVFLALTVMTRPEGALLVILLMIDCGIRSWKERKKSIFYMAVPAAVLYLPYFLWRYFYYGYFFPNTFYAKVGFTGEQIIRGLNYSQSVILPILILLLLSVYALIRVWPALKLKGKYILPIYALVYAIYVILVGGDVMPAFRFFVPIIPILALIAATCVPGLFRRKIYLILLLILTGAYNIYQTLDHSSITYHIRIDHVASDGKKVGLWLKENVSPGTLLATNAAGAVPYYSELTTIDMLGLNDLHIAHKKITDMGSGAPGHEKGDGKYVLSRKPDLIQFFSSIGSLSPSFRSDHELWDLPEFHERYAPRVADVSGLENGAVFYVRRSDIP